MSKDTKDKEMMEEMEEIEDGQEDPTDIIRSVLEKLVPPSEVQIEDMYGNNYELRTKISARSQIKLLRKFEEVTKEVRMADFISMDEEINSGLMIRAIMKMATKEEIMTGIESCFSIAHPHSLKKAIEA